jgi:hypothetical protein
MTRDHSFSESQQNIKQQKQRGRSDDACKNVADDEHFEWEKTV